MGTAARRRANSDPAHGDHPPERGERQRGRASSTRPARWSCRAGPVAVHRLRRRRARRTGEEPERAGCATRSGSLVTAPISTSRGRRMLTRGGRAAGTPTSRGSPRQMPRPTKTATKTGASAVPSPSRAFRTSTGGPPPRVNAAVKVLSVGTVRPKPTPEGGRRHEQECRRRRPGRPKTGSDSSSHRRPGRRPGRPGRPASCPCAGESPRRATTRRSP